jgi:lysophospholipase L1-like esterase
MRQSTVKTPEPLFSDSDVVAMIGDSITCDGRWWVKVREQWLARHPGAFCDFRNCGIPGGVAEGALRRYAWDIAPLRPTVALVMFGMNDVWREGYRPPVTEEMLTGRADCLQRFLSNMNDLVERLVQDGVRVVLLTPTPFDQYASDRPAPNLPGVDDALAVCAGMVRGISAVRRLTVVDLHTTLRRRCVAGESLISEDRVHPSDLGHTAMAELVSVALLPGASVVVSPELRAASQALHEAESRQRIIAMFRCWAEGVVGGKDDDAVRRFLERNEEEDQNPWILEQKVMCRRLLPRQEELATEVAVLRQRLTELVVTGKMENQR